MDDAVFYLLLRPLTHLEKAGRTVRIFNTIQPTPLRDKLERIGVNQHLTAWTLDYLTNRPQYVRLWDCEPDMVVYSTGPLQGGLLGQQHLDC